MRVSEAKDGGIRIMVARTGVPSFGARIGAELHHAKRDGCTRIGVAMAICADHGERFDSGEIAEWFDFGPNAQLANGYFALGPITAI